MAQQQLPLLSEWEWDTSTTLDRDLEAFFLSGISFGVLGPDPTPATPTAATSAAATPPEEEDTPADDDLAERRLRRQISNRESARRSRARKQRHLDELRGRGARLRSGNRDLAARLRGAQARAALVRVTNARLRAEAGALARRLAAARRALALRQVYAATASGGAGFFDLQALASLIA